MATPIGTLGTIPTITVGGRVFTDLTTIIILQAYMNSSAATRYSTFRRTSSGYQVTTAKTLKLHAAKWSGIGTNSGGFTMGYGDNDVGFSSASAPTNETFPFYGSATNSVMLNGRDTTSREPVWDEMAFDPNNPNGFAATKYPFLLNQNSTTNSNVVCQIFGYEV